MSSGRRIFKHKVVLKRKFNPPDEFNPQGSLDKYKCRMTVQAFTKMLKQGIDYEEKHAGTVRWNAIKVLFAVAVQYDLDIWTIDIKTFFLYGILPKSDTVYMEIPEGWEEEGVDRKAFVWELQRSLYGMPQAPHLAQKALRSALVAENTFVASSADDCVYVTRDSKSGYAASGTHVDDEIVIGDPRGVKKAIDTLEKKFKITHTKNPSVITGVQIERNRPKRWLKLHQGAYTKSILEKFRMADARPVDTPMDPGTAKLLMTLPTEHSTPASCLQYQRIVGALMWLLRTRPDLHFTINLLCRFLKNATPEHVAIARARPFRYLAGTPNYGIVFYPGKGNAGDGEWCLSGSCDADLAGDVKTSRSTIGGTLQLGRYGNVACRSSLEKKICTSTGQSETYACSSLGKEVIWTRHLLRDLLCPQRKPTGVQTDNDGVFKQSTKAINHATAKHYRIAQAFIRQICSTLIMKMLRVDHA